MGKVAGSKRLTSSWRVQASGIGTSYIRNVDSGWPRFFASMPALGPQQSTLSVRLSVEYVQNMVWPSTECLNLSVERPVSGRNCIRISSVAIALCCFDCINNGREVPSRDFVGHCAAGTVLDDVSGRLLGPEDKFAHTRAAGHARRQACATTSRQTWHPAWRQPQIHLLCSVHTGRGQHCHCFC